MHFSHATNKTVFILESHRLSSSRNVKIKKMKQNKATTKASTQCDFQTHNVNEMQCAIWESNRKKATPLLNYKICIFCWKLTNWVDMFNGFQSWHKYDIKCSNLNCSNNDFGSPLHVYVNLLTHNVEARAINLVNWTKKETRNENNRKFLFF